MQYICIFIEISLKQKMNILIDKKKESSRNFFKRLEEPFSSFKTFC